MQLYNRQEIVGTLNDIQTTGNDQVTLTFIINTYLELPEAAIPISDLQALIGKKVAIINIDTRYFIRAMD